MAEYYRVDKQNLASFAQKVAAKVTSLISQASAGFEPTSIAFGEDRVTETSSSGTRVTVFRSDGAIVETTTISGTTKTKTTTFNADGSITITYS